MDDNITKQGRFFRAIPDVVRKYRWLIWGVFIASVIAISPGVTKFKLDLSDEFFFQENDPVRMAYDKFREQFGGDESIYVVYRAKDNDVFSKKSLTALRNLQEELLNYRMHLQPGEQSALDRVVDITSLINVSYLQASDDALVSRQFVGERIPQTVAESDAYRRQALAHPDYPLLYVSNDSQYAGIVIRTDFKTVLIDKQLDAQLAEMELGNFDVVDIDISTETSSSSEIKKYEAVEMGDYAEVVRAVNTIINKPEYSNVLEYYPVGVPSINAYVWDNFMGQVNMVMTLTFIITLLMLWFLFRSLSAVIWPIIIVVIASILTVAIFGWLGLKMNLMVNVTVLLILVVGVADSVHILSGYLYFRNQGEAHQEAMRSTFEKSGLAVFLTSLTTAVGMLALLVVPLVPIQNFGLSAAIGVFLAFVLSVFVLPLMLDLWAPFSKKKQKNSQEYGSKHHLIQAMLQKVEHLSHQRPGLNILVFAIITVIFAVGVFRVEVDSNPASIFVEGNVIRTAINLVDDKMGGTQNMEIMIDAGVEGALQDPAVLKAMDEIQNFLEQEVEGVVLTQSLANIVKDSNKSLNGGREEFYFIPDDPRVLQQTLFLYNDTNPTDRRRVVSDDYRQAHITVNMKSNGSKKYVVGLDIIRKEIDQRFSPLKVQYPNLDVSVTGGVTIFATLIDYISWSQIQGFGFALLAISFILFFLFASFRIGMIALFPNIFPLIIVFGTMGYLNIPLDVDTLIVAPLMIGIVVDDTIHFLTHYREEVLKHGDTHRAIIKAFREVGQAITFTSIILAAAFFTFVLLDHQGMKHFGMLSAVAIITALIAELFLLPALLLKGKVTFQKAHNNSAVESALT